MGAPYTYIAAGKRRRNVLSRVFVGGLALGFAAGSFAATAAWLVLR